MFLSVIFPYPSSHTAIQADLSLFYPVHPHVCLPAVGMEICWISFLHTLTTRGTDQLPCACMHERIRVILKITYCLHTQSRNWLSSLINNTYNTLSILFLMMQHVFMTSPFIIMPSLNVAKKKLYLCIHLYVALSVFTWVS